MKNYSFEIKLKKSDEYESTIAKLFSFSSVLRLKFMACYEKDQVISVGMKFVYYKPDENPPLVNFTTLVRLHFKDMQTRNIKAWLEDCVHCEGWKNFFDNVKTFNLVFAIGPSFPYKMGAKLDMPTLSEVMTDDEKVVWDMIHSCTH